MDLQKLSALAEEFLRGSDNYIDEVLATAPECVGLRLFDPPVFGTASADDPIFETFRDDAVVSSEVLLPRDWLPGARTVISFFLPASEEVRKSNRKDPAIPSPHWQHARIEGNECICRLCAFLNEEMHREGIASVSPSIDPRFLAVKDASKNRYWSNWSERHTAYACGLGTFGLSKGLITEKGIAGRFASIITDLELPVAERPYTGIYDWCIFCGKCARNCPAGAIDPETGKHHPPCQAYLDKTSFGTRYGCGKCQVGVPCESRRPRRD